MAVYNILPSENLKDNDIRDTINAYGGVADNVDSSYFTKDNINECSKYKPVRHTEPFLNTDERWKGADGNCGYYIPQSSNYVDIPSWYDESGLVGMNGWEYLVPRGSSSEPFRWGDFRGYTPLRYPITSGFYCAEEASRANGATLLCQCMTNPSSEFGLTLNNIAAIKDNYFGVYAVNKADTSTYKIAFASEKGGTSVELPTSLSPQNSEWYVYPFFANKNVHEQGTIYRPVPYVARREFKIVATLSQIRIQISGMIDEQAKTCSYSILALNEGQETTLSNNAVYMKYDGNDLSDATELGEKYEAISSIRIPTSNTYQSVYSGTFTNLDAELIKSGKLWVTMSTAKYTASVYPMKSPAGQVRMILSE